MEACPFTSHDAYRIGNNGASFELMRCPCCTLLLSRHRRASVCPRTRDQITRCVPLHGYDHCDDCGVVIVKHKVKPNLRSLAVKRTPLPRACTRTSTSTRGRKISTSNQVLNETSSTASTTIYTGPVTNHYHAQPTVLNTLVTDPSSTSLLPLGDLSLSTSKNETSLPPYIPARIQMIHHTQDVDMVY